MYSDTSSAQGAWVITPRSEVQAAGHLRRNAPAARPVRRVIHLRGACKRVIALVGSVRTALLLCTSVVAPTAAQASDCPMVPGDFREITGVHLKDGGGLAHAKFLASQWKADQEFARSKGWIKGWIKGYTILSNSYPRKGDEYLAWKKKTDAQLSKESADRVEIREIESNELRQEMKFKAPA